MRPPIARHPLLAVLTALVLGLAGGFGLAAAVLGEGGQEDASRAPSRPPEPSSERERERADRSPVRSPAEPAQPRSGEAGSERERRSRRGERGARAGDEPPARRRTTVPDELVGQTAEVSAEDLRLSGLRAEIRGRPRAVVCAARPPEGATVARGATVTLRTRC